MDLEAQESRQITMDLIKTLMTRILQFSKKR